MASKIDAKMRGSLGQIIGHGAFGVIYAAKSSSKEVIKVIDLAKLSDDMMRVLQDEVFILPRLKHRNVIAYRKVVRSQRFLYIYMPYYPETLRDVMNSYASAGEQLDTVQVLAIVRQMCEGLAYLHDPMKYDSEGQILPQIIHRDLKPENVLVSKDHSTFVLADFGLCRVLEHGECANTVAGTPFYTAPEIRQRKNYDTKADMWSLGAILYELVTGERPDMPLQWDRSSVIGRWRRKFARIESTYLRAITSHLLMADQSDRSSAAELLQLLNEAEDSILLGARPQHSQARGNMDISSSSSVRNGVEEDDRNGRKKNCAMSLRDKDALTGRTDKWDDKLRKLKGSVYVPGGASNSTSASYSSTDSTSNTDNPVSNLTLSRRIDGLIESNGWLAEKLSQVLNVCAGLQEENERIQLDLDTLEADLGKPSETMHSLTAHMTHIDRELKRVINTLIPIETRMAEIVTQQAGTRDSVVAHTHQLEKLSMRLKLLEDTCEELKQRDIYRDSRRRRHNTRSQYIRINTPHSTSEENITSDSSTATHSTDDSSIHLTELVE